MGFTDPLYALLRSDDAPAYEEMLSRVAEWLRPLSKPREAEQEYMTLLDERAEHRPELLFADWPETLERARRDPVMAWKVRNLRQRIRGD